MKKTLPIVVAVALVAACIAFFRWRRDGSTPQAPAASAPVAKAPEPKPTPVERPKNDGPPPELTVTAEDDPPGTLRLEGQVIDSEERPVAGATVLLASNPRRTAKSENDGSFVFEKLVARTYALQATKDTGVAGASVRLTGKTEPVILKLKDAGGLEVTVVAVEDRKPVAGAEVSLHDEPNAPATTSAEGKAVLRGVDHGFHQLEVTADGFASSVTFVEVSGRAGATEKQTVELRRGAGASGKVVDPSGKPVAGARVRPIAAASFGFLFGAGARDGVLSDKNGRWSIPALPAGSFRFSASHERHGPGLSMPVALDGHVEKKDITIALEAGARIAGVVVDKSGAPTAAAAVKLVVKGAGFSAEPARQVFTDEKGHFEVGGLPRKAIDLLASSESASSEVMTVDLAAKPEATDLLVVLDLGGTIAGTVVDTKNQPIPGAQVLAGPELGSRRDNMASWRLRGAAKDVADSGGHFEIHGLPEGDYRIRAGRSGNDELGLFSRPGVSAKTGDMNVRITVPDDGKVVGKVLFADGSVPKSFQVAVSFGRGSTFADADGKFDVEGPAGTVSLIVTGPELVQKVVPNVEVKAEDTTDVGTITVERGRSVSGRVLRPDGSPVVAAKVAAGNQLMGSGAELSGGGLFGSMGGNKSTTSGDDGGYVLSGVGERPFVLVADSESDGRSPMARVPAGKESVTMDLILQPTGSLEGRVTSAGQPATGTVLMAQPQQASKGTFIVRTDDTGSYRYDKLAPDTYVVSSMAAGQSGRGANLHSKTVQVQSGQTTHLDLDVSQGTITVVVTIATPPGANVHSAQIFLVSGSISATNAEQLGEVAAAHGEGASHVAFAMNDKPAQIDAVTPGSYSACVIPIPGDINDMGTITNIMQHPDKLIAVCVPVNVTAAPDKQSVTVRAPAPPPI